MSLTGDVLGQIGAEVSLNGGVGGSIQFTGEGTDNYDELDNRPSINGVVLTGNKTTEDLHIDTGGTDDYLDLNNKPKINSVTLRGDVSSASLQISYNDLIDRPVIPDITDLENRMDAVEGDIQAIETDIGDIGDRLVDIASDIATIQATDLVQNADISSLKSRMNAAENNIINLGSRLTTAEGDISGLDNRLGTAEDNISDAQNDISDLQGDVTSLDTIVGNGQQTVGSDLTDAVTQLNSSKANKQWTRILNLSITSNTDQTVQVTYPDGYSELLFSVQRADNGRTIGTTIIPRDQFTGGACYVGGSYTIVSLAMNSNANEYVNGVFIYSDATHIEVAFNKGNVNLTARVFAR